MIMNLCLADDLKNLSLVNSYCNSLTKMHLFRAIRITEDNLDDHRLLTDHKVEELTLKLQHTEVIRISAYRSGVPKILCKVVSKLDKLEELDLCRSTNVTDSHIRYP